MGRRFILVAAGTVLLRGALLVVLPAGAASAQDGGAVKSPDLVAEIGELRRQHAELLSQVVTMSERLERLVRVAREGVATPDELQPLISALDSDSYRERLEATTAIRRALVDRLWLLLDTPDLSGEARHRLNTLIVETTAMIRLTAVAAELSPPARDALWNLLHAEPGWVLAALGEDPREISAALRHPPPGHGAAAEVVLAALLRDELRPVPQQAALAQVDEATSPILRDALKGLVSPAYRARSGRLGASWSHREQAAKAAVRILARTPSKELVAFFLAYLDATETWSAAVEFQIIDALVAMRARGAAGTLVEIGQAKRKRLSGGQSVGGILVKPGDCEIIGAALLLGIDLGDLEIRQRPARGDDEPPFYGFEAPKPPRYEQRDAAFEIVERAASDAGPFPPVPGLEEALREMRERE